MESPKQEFIIAVHQIVSSFFDSFPVPAHGADHAERVADYAKTIAEKEGMCERWLAEIAGLLHDIGRVPEKYSQSFPQFKKGLSHHEYSYLLLREWIRDNSIFSTLSNADSLSLLYALRYHYNDVADDEPLAIVLRDADKLDLMGEVGLARHLEWVGKKENTNSKDIWLRYYSYYWLRTKTARTIVDTKKLLEPFDRFMREIPLYKVEGVEL